jgi:hypothetical protein
MRGGYRPGSGRKPGFTHSELTRERIRTGMLLNRLQNFVMGRGPPMSPHQVTAALGLLAKTIPDLRAIEHAGETEHTFHTVSGEPLTEEAWAELYGGRRLH